MKILLLTLSIALVISMSVVVYAQERTFQEELDALSRCEFGISSGGACAEEIPLCPSGTILTQFGCVDRNQVDPSLVEEALLAIELANTDIPQDTVISIIKIPETFDGTNSIRNSMQSFSFLEWKLVYQDGTETGTTEFVSATFQPFTLSFIDERERFRTLLFAEVRGIQSFAGIGTSFCHTLPSQTYNQEILLNGRTVSILKQLFGQNDFNPLTSINRGFGVKFTPSFVESQIASKGIDLKTGDVITWKITSNNRYTLYLGGIASGDTACKVTRGTAWDGFTTGMAFQHQFVYVNPIELIVIPSTTEPDLDGDGIPDRIDQCDFTPERFNGFQDTDGCPDNDPPSFDPTTITDQDGDGILDVDDLCPTQPEIFNGIDDGDGCPDGASLDVNFMSFDATGQQTVDLTVNPIPPDLPPIFTGMQTETAPLGIDDSIDGISEIKQNPETNFGVPESISGDPILTTGTSEICDRTVQNCNQVIQSAVQMGAGFMVPFELNLINLIFLIGAVVGVALVIMFVRRRRR